MDLYIARLCDHTPNALNTKSVLRKEIRLKMAHESCKSQIAVLEMNGQSVPQNSGPACAKARTPHDDNVARGTSSCPRFAERRFWRPGSLDAGWHIVDK